MEARPEDTDLRAEYVFFVKDESRKEEKCTEPIHGVVD